jgi:isoquinoline 1-oxidoreductase beta subunit
MTIGRSNFLRVVGAAGAALALGIEIAPPEALAGQTFSPVAWVRMSPDGLTTVMMSQSEMGQAITTGLAMLVAEELDIPFSTVRFEMAPVDPKFYNPVSHEMSTGGSKSTPTLTPVMRLAGATARAMIVAAAAQTWNVDPKTCTTSDGIVTGPAGQTAKFTALLDLAATLPIPDAKTIVLKTPDRFKLIGTRQRRLDLVPKTNGTAVYGIDVKVPGMKYASIEKPLQIGGTIATFDAAAALKTPGVRSVIRVPSGIAVVADNTWAAFQGRKALKVTYAAGPNAGVSTASIYGKARELVKTDGAVIKSVGDAKAALAAGKPIVANYETPYLAHAPMEPMNTTADVRADRVTLWSPTQAPTRAQSAAAKITGLPLEAVFVNTTFLGGGFGRRSETDFVADAVHVSKAAGVPIKLVWTREDDIRNDPYRAGTIHALSATLAADGRIDAYRHTVANSSIAARTRPASIKNGVDLAVNRGTGDFAYAIGNQLVDYHLLDVAIPVGYWRAPLTNANTFATESFIDEVAHAAGKDPVAYRLSMIEPGSRAAAVLERAAKLAAWGSPLPKGHAHGVAMARWDEGWVATVAEVSMKAGKLKVHKLTASVDVGMPINIEGIEQQVPSAMIYGLSAALTGKITFADGVPQQKNFTDYPVLHMADSPEFVVDIVRNLESPMGAGEIGTPCVAPALANAIFALNGKRIRTLPLNDALA